MSLLSLSLSLGFGIQRAHLLKIFKANCLRNKHHLWKVQRLPPLRGREPGKVQGFLKSQSMSLTETRSEMHLSAFFFFLNQGSLVVDCFFLKKPTFPSKTATSVEWRVMKSDVTLNCSLFRQFSLLRGFQVPYENHSHYLARCEPSSERQPFPY